MLQDMPCWVVIAYFRMKKFLVSSRTFIVSNSVHTGICGIDLKVAVVFAQPDEIILCEVVIPWHDGDVHGDALDAQDDVVSAGVEGADGLVLG